MSIFAISLPILFAYFFYVLFSVAPISLDDHRLIHRPFVSNPPNAEAKGHASVVQTIAALHVEQLEQAAKDETVRRKVYVNDTLFLSLGVALLVMQIIYNLYAVARYHLQRADQLYALHCALVLAGSNTQTFRLYFAAFLPQHVLIGRAKINTFDKVLSIFRKSI